MSDLRERIDRLIHDVKAGAIIGYDGPQEYWSTRIGAEASAEIARLLSAALSVEHPLGYAYEAEVQSGKSGFYVSNEKTDKYDLPVYVAAPSAPDGWCPIASAPKDGSKVDLWGINNLHYAKEGKRVVNVAWGPVRDWMGTERDDWQHGFGEDFEPTHWMPLPTPPALGGADR